MNSRVLTLQIIPESRDRIRIQMYLKVFKIMIKEPLMIEFIKNG